MHNIITYINTNAICYYDLLHVADLYLWALVSNQQWSGETNTPFIFAQVIQVPAGRSQCHEASARRKAQHKCHQWQ